MVKLFRRQFLWLAALSPFISKGIVQAEPTVVNPKPCNHHWAGPCQLCDHEFCKICEDFICPACGKRNYTCSY